MKQTITTAACLLLLWLAIAGQTKLNRDAKSVKFVTSDIDNFWKAYDLAKNATGKRKVNRRVWCRTVSG